MECYTDILILELQQVWCLQFNMPHKQQCCYNSDNQHYFSRPSVHYLESLIVSVEGQCNGAVYLGLTIILEPTIM